MVVPQPYLALPLAVMSHFAMDALPHYGHGGNGYSEAFKYRLTAAMESVNLVGIPLFMYILWDESWLVWLAALLAVSPDFMWVYRYFWYERHGELPSAGPITHFHKTIQWCERRWGIYVEVPVLIGLVTLVASLAL